MNMYYDLKKMSKEEIKELSIEERVRFEVDQNRALIEDDFLGYMKAYENLVNKSLPLNFLTQRDPRRFEIAEECLIAIEDYRRIVPAKIINKLGRHETYLSDLEKFCRLFLQKKN